MSFPLAIVLSVLPAPLVGLLPAAVRRAVYRRARCSCVVGGNGAASSTSVARCARHRVEVLG